MTRPILYRLADHVDEWPVLRCAFWLACCALGIGWGIVWGRVSIWVMP